MKSCVYVLGLLAASVVAAPAAVIDFSGFTDQEVLTNQDFGDGITFNGATVLTCCVSLGSGSLNDAFPPVGGVAAGQNVAYNPGPGDMILDFTAPVDFFDAFFTYNDGLTVTAYDVLNNVVGTANGACGAAGSGGANYTGAGCGAPNEELNITDLGMISKIDISGGAGNNFTIDDVSFTGSINAGTPEPGTITMLLGGLGCVIGFARKRRTAR